MLTRYLLLFRKNKENTKNITKIKKNKIIGFNFSRKNKPKRKNIIATPKRVLKLPQKPIKKADAKVLSCACASILAKVTRDRLMKKEDKKYPEYKFSKHKGYGTNFHFRILKKYGPCKIHRKSFRPVRK